MANTGGTYAGTGNVPLAVREQGKQAPAKRAASQRVQRFYNKASGRMETAQAMHSYQRPAPQPAQQPQQRPAGRAPAGRPAPSRNVPFIQQTPQEIEARARAITQSELSADRVPFQQQLGILGGEQQTAGAANTAAYGKLGGVIAGQQAQQEASAKTYENFAADAVNKAAQAAPGAAETAERLGLKPGEALPESARRQQEAARTLLSGIALSSQAGTNARQQAESDRLSSALTNSAQAGTETGTQIAGQFSLQKAKVLAAEQGLIAKSQGSQASLTQRLLGEQEKDKIAAAGLNIKGSQLQINAAKEQSTAQNQRLQRQGEAAKIGQGNQKLAQGQQKLANEGRKIANDEKYKRAGAADKERKDALDIQGKELDIGKKIKEASNKSGKPITQGKVDEYKHEAAYIFNTFQRGREEGRSYADMRKELEEGHARENYTKPKNSKGEKLKGSALVHFKGVKTPILLTVAEQSIDNGFVNAAVKQQLREEGLPDSGWSNNLYSGSGKTRPSQGNPTAGKAGFQH